jgi:hypothetical protein
LNKCDEDTTIKDQGAKKEHYVLFSKHLMHQYHDRFCKSNTFQAKKKPDS